MVLSLVSAQLQLQLEMRISEVATGVQQLQTPTTSNIFAQQWHNVPSNSSITAAHSYASSVPFQGAAELLEAQTQTDYG